ncbi:hypothetical protein FH972_019561 [Carpinus fangiana]|uniref:Uncharacterized protein n=1 Tax=Carpinus fangiana TaxID=176857 RepID=A0A5N6RS02_9ROSI|nr:hypothetical protein FH972_019561 [Carpinus fangiana]
MVPLALTTTYSQTIHGRRRYLKKLRDGVNLQQFLIFPGAHPLLEETALEEEEADWPPSTVEGPPPPVTILGRQRYLKQLRDGVKLQQFLIFPGGWLVMINDSSTTNVLIYNLLPTPIAHPLLEEKAIEEEADQPPLVGEGPPTPVGSLFYKEYNLSSKQLEKGTIRSHMMNSKGTKYGVLGSYDTLFVDDPWKMKIFEAILRWAQLATLFNFSWRLVVIHDSSTTNVGSDT